MKDYRYRLWLNPTHMLQLPRSGALSLEEAERVAFEIVYS